MLRIAVCDDEKYFRNQVKEILADYLAGSGILFEIDTFCSGEAFAELGIEMLRYKIAFLDIVMDELDGIMTAKKIREVSKDMFVVFITAYMNYTLEGYKVDAVRYILKDRNLVEAIGECIDAIIEKMNYMVPWKEFCFIEGYRKVSVNRLLYIESRAHKLEFYIMENRLKKYTLYGILNQIEIELAGDSFIRVHQSFLVNMRYIKEISRYQAMLNNGVQFSIARKRYRYVEEMFAAYREKI